MRRSVLRQGLARNTVDRQRMARSRDALQGKELKARLCAVGSGEVLRGRLGLARQG